MPEKIELLKGSIDKRNKGLWVSLNEEFEINLYKSPEDNYLLNFKDNLVSLYIDTINPSPEAFVHELLHLELRRKRIFISKDLVNTISINEKLDYLFSKTLEEHICNCIEHIKMFDVFIDMGYESSTFLSDFAEPKMTNDEILNLRIAYKQNRIVDKDALNFYIGKFFSMKACSNPEFNYETYYYELNKLDSKLYYILNHFWVEWLNFDINQPDQSYQSIINDFTTELLKWLENNFVI
ncbi:hypothetical protein [Mangrovivirga cuniculi]|uniref:Uncharacterized protein n=1 Tax=Mangrovivirga cuniculi TaxID=2715131 RepID=A0A4D7JKJ1_9BACT|nr:hypothetical protein [Mangrovivirga cuniculi]QCK15217.1 hypothetical protein DCC35_10905 [Mangrovivirga cuniculi]